MEYHNLALPKMVMIEVTNNCNLKCSYCIKSKINYQGKNLGWEDFLNTTEKIKEIERVCLCGLGEQVLHPKFYDMLHYLEDHKVSIITNGTIPIKYDLLMYKNNIEFLTFSVDGHNEEICKKSCSEYIFKNLLQNLSEAKKYKDLHIGINFVLSDSNVSYLKEMIDFCIENGVSTLNFIYPSYDTKWVNSNRNKVDQIIDDLIIYADEKLCVNSPYYQYCQYDGAPISYIGLNGMVRPCCNHYNDVPIMGSIKEKNFIQLWESEKMDEFKNGNSCRKCKMYRR